MDWFRHFHRTMTDPRWIVVAASARSTPLVVGAVWCELMETASAARPRGNITSFDAASFAAFGGADAAEIVRVYDALKLYGRHDGTRLINWEKRNPKDATGAARQAKHKAKKRAARASGNALPAVTPLPTVTRGDKSEALGSVGSSSGSDTSIHLPPSHAHEREREATPKGRGRVLDWVKSLVSQEGGSDANRR